ncbi:ABC transporter ATP-binding protein [Accumulibacter sp.]|uniref:ABC transporter related n=1 Tax=Accumulibacter regalis TaxID=522306 RepID=C7RSE4_ACCRE|nr:ABC transporter ATP-binding protein [Accumulibacter sp.]
MTYAILVEGIHKTYSGGWRKPSKVALKGISLSIDAGETFGFIGPNGAGKSTLIKILIGALLPTAGSASLFDCDVREPEARRGLGFVPENPSLQDFLTPYEILLMGLRLHGLRIGDERKHCMHWLERFDLAAVADSRLRGFSKGMLQRTALAHALAIKPRLLILDEPLSGLDPVGRKDVVDILDEYRQQGGTLFFSSHVLHDVERIADRFGLIHRGQLLTIRSPQELAADQADRFVLRYRGGAPIEGCSEVRPGLFTLDAGAADLPALIARVNSCGGVLQDVKPSVSLETVFFRTISSSDVAGR